MGGIIGLTVELLGVVVADSQVVEDAVERLRELAAVDLVGEEADELQLRGHRSGSRAGTRASSRTRLPSPR